MESLSPTPALQHKAHGAPRCSTRRAEFAALNELRTAMPSLEYDDDDYDDAYPHPRHSGRDMPVRAPSPSWKADFRLHERRVLHLFAGLLRLGHAHEKCVSTAVHRKLLTPSLVTVHA